MEVIFDILFVYALLYTIYFVALAIRNLNDNKFKISKRYAQFEEKDNIAVIIYAHNNKVTLNNLINQLKSQDYPFESYSIYVILDNCIDGSETIFEHEPYIKVINVSGVGTIGKDEAVSRLLERLKSDNTIDSYLFLDGDRSVPTDFLSNVNASLAKNAVISGETLIDEQSLGPIDKIKAAYQKYHMNFIRQARTLFGLAAMADSGVFVIRKEIIDQFGPIDFKSINDELKYSLLLSKVKYPCSYDSNIQTYVDTTTYTFKKPSLSFRLDLFKNCFTQVFKSNPVFAEHTFSLLYPNIWLLMFIYALILSHSYTYRFMVDFKVVVFAFMMLTIGFVISLVNSKLKPIEIVRLCLYPIYSICHIFKNFPPVRMLRAKIMNPKNLNSDVEKMGIDIIVNVGENQQIPCKLEFISEYGLAKIRFIYKHRKFTTNNYVRMIDAISELQDKLAQYNFTMRICSSCKHFRLCQDGSKNMLKGFCDNQFPSINVDGEKPTLVWNTCSEFEAIEKKEKVKEETSTEATPAQ